MTIKTDRIVKAELAKLDKDSKIVMGKVLPKNVPEVEGMRTERSKTFKVGEKQYRLLASRKAIHYKKNGKWQDIDTTPRKLASKFVVDKAPYKVEVKLDRPNITYTGSDGKKVSVSLVSIGAETDLAFSEGQIKENHIIFTEIAAGVDIDIEFRPRSFEVFKIVKNASSPKQFVWEYQIDKDSKAGIRDARDIFAYDAKGRMVRMDNTKSEETERAGKRVFRVTEKMTDDVAQVKNFRLRVKKWGKGIEYPVKIDVSVNEPLADNDQDGGEFHDGVGSGNWYATPYANTISVGFFNYGYGDQYYNGGFRFTTVAIPKGATITSATITYYVFSGHASTDVRVYGDDVDDAAAWAYNSDFTNWVGPSKMTYTTAYGSIGYPGYQESVEVDIASVVQEIVNRGGWSSGNDMRFGFINQESTTTGIGMFLEDYSHANSNEAELDVVYTASDIDKVSGVAQASIGKVSGVANASISKVAGVSN